MTLLESLFFWVSDLNAWITLATLIFLEIILGIDNLIFLSIIISTLPENKKEHARIIGLGLAMISRIALLIGLFWIAKLTKPLFLIQDFAVSGRDLVLFFGGLFLIYKATSEINSMRRESTSSHTPTLKTQFGFILIQIMILDIVFSLDSVITAVGMVDILPIMILAILISIFVMLFASKGLSQFIESHPRIKILALAFLILVGGMLIGDSLHLEIPKSYAYFTIMFSLSVEAIHLYLAKCNATQG